MSAPVYWQRSAASGGPLLYIWSRANRLKAFPFNGRTFANTPSAQGSFDQSHLPLEEVLTLSANGETPGTGVLWATVRTNNDKLKYPAPAALYAFDAGDVARELWNSNMDATDSFGNFAKFVPPLVANGRVYVATWSKQVAVYGLRSQQ